MRRTIRTAVVFGLVLFLALQVQSGSGPLDDREVRLAVLLAAVIAVVSLRRSRRARR